MRMSFTRAGSNAENESDSEQSNPETEDDDLSTNKYYSSTKIY